MNYLVIYYEYKLYHSFVVASLEQIKEMLPDNYENLKIWEISHEVDINGNEV